MKIYTKNGDQGFTTNIKGEKIHKGDDLIELQGSIDEANAGIGYLRSVYARIGTAPVKEQLDEQMRRIQHVLFKIGGDVSSLFARHYATEEDLQELEIQIDWMTEQMGVLKHFICYSGNEAAAYCQVLRSISRRAERAFARVIKDETVPSLDFKYMNRLADYLFTLGRYLNYVEGTEEEAMRL